MAISSYSQLLRICRSELLVAGNEVTAGRICSPIGLSDLAPFLIVVLILLWPDISSVGLFGLSLQKRTEQLERNVTLLVATLTPAENVNRSLAEKEKEWKANE